MKPSVFVGSSSEALTLARLVKKSLAENFEADLWSEDIFELGGDTLDELIKFVQCYDFAVLILSEDDILEYRKSEQKSPRDNVIFELGMFMSALGRRRTFPIICKSKGAGLKIPTDLLGNTATYFDPSIVKNPTLDTISTEMTRIVAAIEERSKESTLQLLPSTGLAIGYFNNFVLPVCQELANRDSVEINGTDFDISRDNFDFTIVLPASLSDASIQGAQKFIKTSQVSGFTLKMPSRPFNFYVDATISGERAVFFDYPTTLGASHEAVKIALAGPFMTAGGGRHKILDAKEISNFERTIRILLSGPNAAEFRDNVRFITAP